MLAQGTEITQRTAQKCSTLCWYSRIPTFANTRALVVQWAEYDNNTNNSTTNN